MLEWVEEVSEEPTSFQLCYVDDSNDKESKWLFTWKISLVSKADNNPCPRFN